MYKRQVLHRDAHFDQGQGTHVLRDARRDGLVDVIAALVLVHDGYHEGRVLLDVDGLVAREAEHDVLRQGVVEAYGALGPLPVSYTHLDVYKRQGWSAR